MRAPAKLDKPAKNDLYHAALDAIAEVRRCQKASYCAQDVDCRNGSAREYAAPDYNVVRALRG